MIRDTQKCHECKQWHEVDAGIWECISHDQVTGKCNKYVFVCDDCFEKRKTASQAAEKRTPDP